MHVYLLVNNATGLIYVGQTKASIQDRWRRHVQKARSSSETTDLHKAIVEHGEGAFSFSALEECSDLETLYAAERKWISTLRSQDPEVGYNRTSGGQTGEISDSVRLKISVAARGRPKSEAHRRKLSEVGKALTGNKNPFFGKKHSEATKEKIATSMRGVLGPCFGRVGSKHPLYGKRHSLATRQKMSATRSGKPLSPEHIAKIKAGRASRIQLTRERNAQIVVLFKQGLSRKAIASRLGLTMNVVYAVIASAAKRGFA